MNLSPIISQLISVARTDAAKTVLPLLGTFFNSISTNPTAINVTAQLALLQVGVLSAIPNIAQDELKALAGLINSEAQSLLNPKP